MHTSPEIDPFRSNRLSHPEDLTSLHITEGHQPGRLPVQEEYPTGSDQNEKPSHNSKNSFRVISACLMSFGNGINDSTPGALIPYIEKDYNIKYAIVSMVFVANAVGFLLAAPMIHAMEAKIGHAKSYLLAMSSFAVGYAIIIPAPPFAVVAITFLLCGFGLAVNLALSNAFCGSLPNATVSLGYLHGAYGISGTIAPIVATSMASNGIGWSIFYAIPMSVAVINMALSSWAFAHYSNVSSQPAPSSSPITSGSQTQVFKNAIQNRTTLLGALFIFVYQGAEVSVSGWIVSFLTSYRHGDLSRVGYVSAGFWGGITVGRLCLSYPSSRLGEKVSAILMVLGAIALQVLIWLIPNLIANCVMVAFLGVSLGAVYPCAVAVFTKLLPAYLHVPSLSLITALGSSGGAALPFLVGILSQQFGTVVLHPVCVASYGIMVIAWILLPRVQRSPKGSSGEIRT